MTKQRMVQIINATEKLPDITRVAAYVRVSSMSEDQLHSFHLQYDHYHGFVSSRSDWTLVDVYADEGLTGTRADKRDDFNRMMRDCRAGKIDRILVKSVARFARNVGDCLQYIRELQAIGVSVYFEEEGIDTRDMPDETVLAIKSVQAQHESMVNSRNAVWSYRERMRTGDFITYHAPIGYVRIDGKLIVDKSAAPIVRRIFDEYLNGKGRQLIAQGLNRDGIKTSENGKWNSNSIAYVLKNEKYIGDALLQKSYTTETLPFTAKRNHGEVPQYYVEASHEPIISKETFYRARELFEWRQGFYQKEKSNNSYALSKKMKCAECGSSFRRKILTNGGIAWECMNHNISAERCSVMSVKEDEVCTAFVTMYNRLKKRRKDILAPMLKYMETVYVWAGADQHEIAHINTRIAETTKKLTKLNSLTEKGVISEALHVKNRIPLERELYELRINKAKLLRQDGCEAMDEIKMLIRLIDSGPTVMATFNPLIFGNMVRTVTISNDNIITFNLVGGLALNEQIPRRKRR